MFENSERMRRMEAEVTAMEDRGRSLLDAGEVARAQLEFRAVDALIVEIDRCRAEDVAAGV